MNRKAILLTGLFLALGASGCQSLGNQSQHLALYAGKRADEQVSLGEMQLARGRAYLDAELTTLAIGQFTLARQDPRTLAAASNGLGVAYARMGRYDLADRYFAAAVTAEPDSARYLRNLAALRGSLPALARAAAPSPAPAAAAAAAAASAHPELRLVRLSRGEVHIGGSAPAGAAPARLASRDQAPVIRVIGPRQPAARFPVVVKLDQLPGLAQAQAERRSFAMPLLAPARPAPAARTPKPPARTRVAASLRLAERTR